MTQRGNGDATAADIVLRDVRVAYGAHRVLHDIACRVGDGTFVALVGASGSGKSTLLKAINRLVPLTGGAITIGGRDCATMPRHVLRRTIGYVFQGVGLFPHFDVAANIAMPGRVTGTPIAAERIKELMHLVGLDTALASRRPDALSGGQAQRVGFARALALAPSIMLMDEPFGALDPVTRARLGQDYRTLHSTRGLTTIMVTHDMTEALMLADRVLVMDGGKLVADQSPRALVQGAGGAVAQAMLAVPRRQASDFAALSMDG